MADERLDGECRICQRRPDSAATARAVASETSLGDVQLGARARGLAGAHGGGQQYQRGNEPQEHGLHPQHEQRGVSVTQRQGQRGNNRRLDVYTMSVTSRSSEEGSWTSMRR